MSVLIEAKASDIPVRFIRQFPLKEITLPAQLGVLEERIIFAPPFVSNEKREAGRLVKTLLKNHDKTPSDVTRHTKDGVTAGIVTLFTEGGHTDMPLSAFIKAAKKTVEGENHTTDRLEKIAEEQRWLRTFSQKETTLAWALVLLRLDQGFHKQEYSEQNATHDTVRNRHETGKSNPDMFNLNRRIEASTLDNEGKPAQLLRLMREDMEPMTYNQLRTCGVGRLMRYLRVLKGATQTDLSKADLLGCTTSTIGSYERGEDAVPEYMIERFISWLKPAGGSAIEKILRQKTVQPERVSSEEDVLEALTEKYLFAEHIQQLEPYDAPTALYKKLENMGTIQPMMLHVYQLIAQEDQKARRRKRYPHQTTSIKKGRIPKLETILQVAQDLNLGFHDQETQLMLRQAESEIREKWSQKTAA